MSAVSFSLFALRLLRFDGNAEHGEERIVSLGGQQFSGSVAGSCGESERAENGEAAHGSNRDIESSFSRYLFKTVSLEGGHARVTCLAL
jgi:hypothetical protein